MNRNKTILFLTIVASILMISIPTLLQIYQNHEERKFLVATKKIMESAEECFYNQVCQGTEVTLAQLKDTGYLETDVVNPKTKMYFDDNIILVYENYSVTFK